MDQRRKAVPVMLAVLLGLGGTPASSGTWTSAQHPASFKKTVCMGLMVGKSIFQTLIYDYFSLCKCAL